MCWWGGLMWGAAGPRLAPLLSGLWVGRGAHAGWGGASPVAEGVCVCLLLLSVVMLEPEIRGRREVVQQNGAERENK